VGIPVVETEKGARLQTTQDQPFPEDAILLCHHAGIRSVKLDLRQSTMSHDIREYLDAEKS
jgi:hypothetical protein